MNYTQNEKILQVKESSLVVGIDIGSETHYARAFDWRGIELCKVIKFSNNLFGFEKFNIWLKKLKEENKKTNVIIGAEPTGHYWFCLGNYLEEKGIKLVLVNPYHVKRSKGLDDNNPSKSDIIDPKTIAGLLIRGRYLEPNIPKGVFSDLRILNNNRLRLLKDLNGIKNKVQRWLKIYFPEYKYIFKDWSGKGSLMILKEIPLPEDVLILGEEKINEIWRNSKVRAVGLKRAKKLIELSKRSIGLKEGSLGSREEIKILMEEYELKKRQIEKIELMLSNLLKEISNSELMLDIKGVGLVTVAGFLAEVGDISKYKSSKQIQKLAGLSIVENSSGKHKGKSKISKQGRKRLRTLLFQVAMPLIGRVDEFKDLHKYYTSRTKNPLKKKQSIVAISCKLIRIFYAILKKGIRYDPLKMINDIKRENVKAA